MLGPLELRRDGRSIELRGSKRRAVLATLVLHANEVVRTDRLIEELWGEDRPANAAAALHSHVSRLRKDLGGDVLVTKPWGYVLRADPDAIDLCRFERLVAEARSLPAHERSTKLLEALALWRGPALADLAREPALQMEIARLEELRLSAVEQRIDAELDLGGHAELVRELEALVAEHPLRERLRGQLILALYRSGRQAEALETYRETRRVLVEELGIEPSPELRELERAILRQDPSLASTAPPQGPNDTKPAYSRWRWPRSPLVAAAVLLFAVAGAAAITRGGGGDASPDSAVTPPAAAAASRSVSAPSTRQKPRRSSPADSTSAPKVKRATAAPDAQSESAPAVRRIRVPEQPARGRPTAQQTSTPPKRTVTTRPKPNPTPPPTPVPKEYWWLADDFENPAFDFARWHLASHGTGVAVAERNGRLEFSVGPDVVTEPNYGVDQHYGTTCGLTDDFDARIEFKLLAWPAANGVYVTLGVYFAPPQESFSAISRVGGTASGGSEAYSSNVGSRRGFVQTADAAGALRVRRKDGILTTYYRHSGGWVRLANGNARGPAVLIVSFNTNADQFGHQAARAAFDNFDATADSVDCPGVPLPPRKPRR